MTHKDKKPVHSSDSSLEDLKDRIASFQKETSPHGSHEDIPTKGGKFFNVGVELVAGVFTGVALGLFVDWIFGSAPWGLIGFFVLGSIAGFFNVYRHISPKE